MRNNQKSFQFEKNTTLLQTKYIMSRTFLGKGIFGTVWKGIRISDGLPIAIKVIPLKKIDSEKLRRSIQFEMSILQKLNHERILKLFDHERTKMYLFMYFEYCGGGDLKKYVDKNGGFLKENRAKFFIKQIAEGIRELYNNGIVHRDLKIENIFLTTAYNVKIGDFGLARRVGVNNLAQTFCGTPLYMAPEVLHSNKYDNSCDLWSLGVLLYEMLFGKFPVMANNIEDLKKKLELEGNSLKIHYPKGKVSNEAVDLMQKLLEVNPKKRISFKEFFEHPYIAITKKQIVEEVEFFDVDSFVTEEEIGINNTLLEIVNNLILKEGMKMKDLFDFSTFDFYKENESFIVLMENNARVAFVLLEIALYFERYQKWHYSLMFFVSTLEIITTTINHIKGMNSKRMLKLKDILLKNYQICVSNIKHIKNKKIKNGEEKQHVLNINVVLYLFCIRCLKEVGYYEFMAQKKEVCKKLYERIIILFEYMKDFVSSDDKKVIERHIKEINIIKQL